MEDVRILPAYLVDIASYRQKICKIVKVTEGSWNHSKNRRKNGLCMLEEYTLHIERMAKDSEMPGPQWIRAENAKVQSG